MDEAYHWYLHSLTNRLFNQFRELAHATAISLAMSTKAVESKEEPYGEVGAPKTVSAECRLTAHQLGLVIAKLLQCDPQHSSVLQLIQAAFARDVDFEEDNSLKSVSISMDSVVSLDELFHQVEWCISWFDCLNIRMSIET